MQNEYTQIMASFSKLPYEAKFKKVKAMVEKLKTSMPFFKEMADMFKTMKNNVHENVLEYLYGAIIKTAEQKTSK